MPQAVSQLARKGLDLAAKGAKTGLRLARTGAEWAFEHARGDGKGAREQAERVEQEEHATPTPEPEHKASEPLGAPARGRGASPPHPAGEPGRRIVEPVAHPRGGEEAAVEETAVEEAAAEEPAAEGADPEAGRPSAAEAVEAELAEPPSWRPEETAARPTDPALDHVDEGTAVAAESSDLGAENGARADVSVAPPWPGYGRMRARDIVDRLTSASPDLAAAVRLYEASTKARKTVLEAAERAERNPR